MSGAAEKLIGLSRAREPDDQGIGGGPGKRIYGKGFQWSGKGGEVERGENTQGSTQTTGLAMKARAGADATFESDLVYGLNDGPLEDFLRITGPQSASVQSTQIEATAGATHADGEEGPALIAPTGTFDDFLGLEDFLLQATGWDAGFEDNAWPRAIKAVHDDGATAQIDLDPAYADGAAGSYGAPLLDRPAGDDISVTVGFARAVGEPPEDIWVSYEGSLPDVGLYQQLVGGRCVKWEWKADGGGKIKEMFEYLFRDFLPPTAASARASVDELDEARNDPTSIKQLKYAALGGSTQILQRSITGAKITGACDHSIQDPTMGADSAFGVEQTGDHEFEVELTVYTVFDAVQLMIQLGREGHQIPFDLWIEDIDGNRLSWHFPRVAFPETAVPASGKGTWKGTPAAGRFSGRTVTVVVQKWPAAS